MSVPEDLIEANGVKKTLLDHEKRLERLETSMSWVKFLLFLILGTGIVNVAFNLLGPR